MSTDGQLDDEFGSIVGGLGTELARGRLDDILAANDGELATHQANELAIIAGRDLRTIRRWQASWNQAHAPSSDTPQPNPDTENDELTVLDRLLTVGTQAFEYDDEMLSLIYLLGGNQSRLREQLLAAGYPMPSLPTMSRRWHDIAPMVRDGARHGLRNRASKLIHLRYSSSEPNQVWQFDSFNLDIYVRTPRGRQPIRPWLLIMQDDHSRFITSWAHIPYRMRAADVLATYGAGIEVRASAVDPNTMIGGYPGMLAFDNERAIRSRAVEQAIAALPTVPKPSPVYTPTSKGKVERVGATIQSLAVTGQPGVVTASERINGDHLLAIDADLLLSFEDLTARIAQQIHAYNYERPHSSLGGRTPYEVYSKNLTPSQVSDEQLASLMMPAGRKDGLRLVSNTGIKAHTRHYADGSLNDHISNDVMVRSWHHQHHLVAAYDTDGHFIALVPDATSLTPDQRRLVIQDRIDLSRQVLHHAKRARAAMREISTATSAGRTLDPVTAIQQATAALADTTGAGSGNTGQADTTRQSPKKTRGVTRTAPETTQATPTTTRRSNADKARTAREVAQRALDEGTTP